MKSRRCFIKVPGWVSSGAFIAAFALLVMVSCSKSDQAPKAHVSMSLDADTVYSGSKTVVTSQISFEHIESLKELKIERETSPGVFSVYEIIPREKISSKYTFTYNMPADKGPVIRFSMTARGTDDRPHDVKKLVIYTTTGFFPLKLTKISRVTGNTPASEKIPNPTPTTAWNIGGTDLGIMWDMENGKTGIFFGDTYGNDFKPVNGGPGPAGLWRYNAFGVSGDKVLDDGLSIDYMETDPGNTAMARQIISKSAGGYTAIPSGAIHINGTDYVHYWDLKSWDGFVTNFASLYKSTDHGRSWTRCTEVYYPAQSKFTCAAYAKKDGYVYMMATKVLRDEIPYLARFKEGDILNMQEYEYWNGTTWVKNDESAATPVFNNAMGEASLRYNQKYKVWMLTYLGRRDIEIRSAKNITGPWSEPTVLVNSSEYPGLYGAFMHPLSTDDEIYFNMSQWVPYNVFFMKAKLLYAE